MDSQEMIERKDSDLRMMEKVPPQGYLGAALASIGVSLLLRILGYKEMALFVGQWPPTFILMALAHKLLQPSAEQGVRDAQEAASEAQRMVSPGQG